MVGPKKTFTRYEKEKTSECHAVSDRKKPKSNKKRRQNMGLNCRSNPYLCVNGDILQINLSSKVFNSRKAVRWTWVLDMMVPLVVFAAEKISYLGVVMMV